MSIEHNKLYESATNIMKDERVSIGAVNTEILSKLNISIDTMPLECQQLLTKTATCQKELDMDQLDPIAISLYQTKELSEDMNFEYEILKLKQKNAKLQIKIDRNNRFLNNLREELQYSRESLATRNPNPENIQEIIRQTKQKVMSYEESCEKAKVKFAKLNVPESIYPKELMALASTLTNLKAEEAKLQARCEDVLFTREARNQFMKIRRQTYAFK